MPRSLILFLRAAAMLWLFAGFSLAGTAQASIPMQTCIAPLSKRPDGSSPAPSSFDCTTRQVEFGPGDFSVELRFKPVTNDPVDPLLLHLVAVWQGSVGLWFHYADGSSERVFFDQASASRFVTPGGNYEVRVPLRAAPLIGISAETHGSANWRGVMLGAELRTHSESLFDHVLKASLFAGFIGLALGLLVYNLAIWWAQRHRFQLYYCGMVGALLAYAVVSSGAEFLLWPDLGNNNRLRLDYVLISLTAICALQFFRHFFGPAVFGRRFGEATRAVILAILVTMSALVVLAPWQGPSLYRLWMVSLGAMLLTIPLTCWAAWRARSRHLGLFLLSWAAPLLISLARIASSVGLVAYNFWLDNGNLIALTAESLISTLMIVARLRDLGEERDAARAAEQSALRLAASDPLTGLLNRRALFDRVTSRKAGYRLMLIDIDRFKTINDRMGHDVGDEVLCVLAEVLQQNSPPESLAARIGGEEFALLVPLDRQNECPPEALLEAVRAKPMPFGLLVTASLGYADAMVASEEDWKRLYRLADAALYRAKADGRDRACKVTDFRPAAAVNG